MGKKNDKKKLKKKQKEFKDLIDDAISIDFKEFDVCLNTAWNSLKEKVMDIKSEYDKIDKKAGKSQSYKIYKKEKIRQDMHDELPKHGAIYKTQKQLARLFKDSPLLDTVLMVFEKVGFIAKAVARAIASLIYVVLSIRVIREALPNKTYKKMFEAYKKCMSV